LVVFVGAVIAGIYKGLKELRTAEPSKANVAAAMLLETVTLNEWSASNAAATRAIVRLAEATEDLRREVSENTDELRTMRRRMDAINPRR
jgi:predicted  nucleic acid-binding Zn-ribbon protein